MIEYKTMQNLFMQPKIPDNPMKHWYDGSRWEMVDYMCEQVLKEFKLLLW
jgi:hypothetical protein